MNDAATRQRYQRRFFLFTRLKAHRRSRWYVQPHSPGGAAVEMQGAVSFVKVKVAAYLDGTISGILHQHLYRVATGIDFNFRGRIRE